MTSLVPLIQALREHSIVPDVIPEDSLRASIQELGVTYNHDTRLVPGLSLPRSDTLEAPQIYMTKKNVREGQQYALVMIDPDLFKKNDPTGQVRHWLQLVTFESPSEADRGSVHGPNVCVARLGRAISAYLPCTPGAGTGKHRYTFVLCQPASNDLVGSTASLDNLATYTKNAPKEDLKDRMGFYFSDFLQGNNLEVVAANFMLVGADARSTLENLGAGAQAVYDKVVGK